MVGMIEIVEDHMRILMEYCDRLVFEFDDGHLFVTVSFGAWIETGGTRSKFGGWFDRTIVPSLGSDLIRRVSSFDRTIGSRG